ncbi:MAG: hypothetical protein RIE73_04420 [Coleofasciculus sp. C1-SOL-03]|uniref:hypothetical protein n=1 Tax=Coleofasciculus sp. C1-SOL-03 TaxID=3069522 RepID=UPI003302B49C
MPNPIRDAAIVIYENRPSHEIALKLLLLSLSAHSPQADIHIFAPQATDSFQNWVSSHSASSHLHLQSPSVATGINVKADALLWALDRGYTRSMWLDSDMILSNPLPKILLDQPTNVLVASELPKPSKTHERTLGWGLEPGRSFVYNPSACCIQVTQAHRPLLEQWKNMMESSEYKTWQARPRNERPRHARGSDALLIALLGSKQYENLPIKLLRNGRDIAHCGIPSSYSSIQRLMSLSWGVPPIIHVMAKKPWLAQGNQLIYATISPYACVARRYKELLQEDIEWLEIPKNWLGIWHNLFRGHPALSSLPLAIRS